jgi:hypothetical protein
MIRELLSKTGVKWRGQRNALPCASETESEMSGAKLPDAGQFGRVLAKRARARMKAEGISAAKVGAIYAHELTNLSRKMVASGTSKHAVADWLEGVTAAYCQGICRSNGSSRNNNGQRRG